METREYFEKVIREEISRMNLRQVESMDAMVEIQEYN